MEQKENKFTDVAFYDDLFEKARSLNFIRDEGNHYYTVCLIISAIISEHAAEGDILYRIQRWEPEAREVFANLLYRDIKKKYIKCVDIDSISVDALWGARLWKCFNGKNGDINGFVYDADEYSEYMSNFLIKYLYDGEIDLTDDNIRFQKMLLYFSIYYEWRYLPKKEFTIDLMDEKCKRHEESLVASCDPAP